MNFITSQNYFRNFHVITSGQVQSRMGFLLKEFQRGPLSLVLVYLLDFITILTLRS